MFCSIRLLCVIIVNNRIMECPVFLGAGEHNPDAISFKSPQQHCGVQDRLRGLASRPRAEPVNAKARF